MKKPTANFASGGGLETFTSLLAVSPRAGSENSLLRLSRGNRHRRRSGNSLRRDGNHAGKKISTRKTGRIEEIEKGIRSGVQKVLGWASYRQREIGCTGTGPREMLVT